MPHRAYHQAPFGPALNLAGDLLRHRHRILIALGDQLQLPRWSLSNDRTQSLLPMPDRLTGRLELALSQLHLRQRAQVKITRGSDPGTRGTRRHLAVTHI